MSVQIILALYGESSENPTSLNFLQDSFLQKKKLLFDLTCYAKQLICTINPIDKLSVKNCSLESNTEKSKLRFA